MKFGEMFNIFQAVSGRTKMPPTLLALGLMMLRGASSATDPRALQPSTIVIAFTKHLLHAWLHSRFST